MPVHKFYSVYNKEIPKDEIEILANQFATAFGQVILNHNSGKNRYVQASRVLGPYSGTQRKQGTEADKQFPARFEIAIGNGPNLGDLCFEPDMRYSLRIRFEANTSITEEQFDAIIRQYSLQSMQLAMDKKKKESHS